MQPNYEKIQKISDSLITIGECLKDLYPQFTTQDETIQEESEALNATARKKATKKKTTKKTAAKKEFTKDDFMKALKKLAKEKGRKEAYALLGEFGAQKSSEMKESDYAEFIKRASE